MDEEEDTGWDENKPRGHDAPWRVVSWNKLSFSIIS